MASSRNRGRTSMRRASNTEKRLPPIEAAVEKVANKKIFKKTFMNKKPYKDETLSKAKIYHKLKKQVLAPFIARLLIRHRWDEMTDNLDEEFTLFDLQTTAQPSRGGNSTVNFTLNPINEQDEDDNDSEASHQDDWRKKGGASGSSGSGSD